MSARDRPGTSTGTTTERSDPEQLRQDIERTRGELGEKVDQIEDRVSPSRIKDRQVERVRGRWQRMRGAVMGESGDGGRSMPSGDRLSGMAQGAGESVQQAPQRAEELTRGNPIAAGLVAAGLGALAGSLLPSTPPERRAAGQLREEFEEPVKASLQESGQELKEGVTQEARHAMEETKQVAQDASERTRGTVPVVPGTSVTRRGDDGTGAW